MSPVLVFVMWGWLMLLAAFCAPRMGRKKARRAAGDFDSGRA
ncbi:hypothetical protein FHX60_000240 [Cupriavidus alkaliphilus]|nr:hypothetical protein [Cupriavidus alkaliphilus]